MGNAAAGRNGDLRIHKRVLQSTTTPFSIRLEKPGRLRTEGGLNEHRGRHENATGPVWQRITGKHRRLREKNEHEAWNALLRDRGERDDLILDQLAERRALQAEIREQRERQHADLLLLREDIARY